MEYYYSCVGSIDESVVVQFSCTKFRQNRCGLLVPMIVGGHAVRKYSCGASPSKVVVI
jgi:hypothetical protein